MATKDKRDERPEVERDELELERELLAEQSRALDARRAELDAEAQRLAAERAELQQQKAEIQSAATVETPAAAIPASNSRHVIMHVLRKFRFQYPLVTRGEMIAPGEERWFEKGDNLLDPEDPRDAFVLNHTWIRDHLADGKIEHPKDTMARLAALAENAKHKAAATRAAIQQAENALLQHASVTHKNEVAADAFLREMNTPINQRHLL